MADENTPKPSYTLHVYYTRYSSWGVRVQLVFEYFNIPYKVAYYNYTDASQTPPVDLTVLPVLDVLSIPRLAQAETEHLRITDSLAICEFLAEQYPDKHLWPTDSHLRATARAVTAQMHSGFAALRAAYPCNFVAKFEGPGIPFDDAIAKDVRKLFTMWEDVRAKTKIRLALLGEEDQGFLCGAFSIADAFFWPVLWRLRTYNVPLAGIGDDGRKWMKTMWNHPVMKAQGNEYFKQERDPLTKMALYDDVFSGKPDVTAGKFAEDWRFDGAAI
ncbi:putative glutathione S transferase [Nemania sp. FL0031]|nr:putative glutathione S transferase [Nemania sp. FL0031]